MAVDVKKIVEDIVTKAKNDPDLMNKLKKDPEKTIESLTGIDIPDGYVDQVVKAVKGKISIDKVSDIMGMLKK